MIEDDYYKKLVKEYEMKEKKKRETFKRWRLKNLDKHRTYMRDYHRRGKTPPIQKTAPAPAPAPTFTKVIQNTLLTFD